LNSQTPISNSQAYAALVSGAERLGLALAVDQFVEIGKFLVAVQEYNEHTNLVGKADLDTLVNDHVLDAFTLVPLISEHRQQGDMLIDIGSGAGFPGIVLAIACPFLQVHLVDSVGKKTNFLRNVVDALELSAKVRVHNARAEELARQADLRESFSFATARAVGKLDLVAELTVPFLHKGGLLFAQKSRRQAAEEVPAARRAITIFGGEYLRTVTPHVVGKGEADMDLEAPGRDLVIVLVEKIKPTAAQYPRRGNQLSRPL
jgi:16S rRNA (guanine527-N7)-methyltransferase